jgi:hypothetical protein
MGRKWLGVLLVLVLCSIPLVAFTWESGDITCQVQDLAGTWSAEVWGGDGPDGQCWDQCDLTVDAGGSILSGSYVDCLGAPSTVIGGQLTISSGCVIEGVIETDGGPVDVANGGIIKDKIYFGLAQPTSPPEEG